METRSQRILNMLNPSKYKTTRGLDAGLQTQAQKNFNEYRLTDTKQSVVSSTSTYVEENSPKTSRAISPLVLVVSPFTVNERSLNSTKTTITGKVNILSDITIQTKNSSNVSSDTYKLNVDVCSEKNFNSFHPNIDNNKINTLSSFCEPKSFNQYSDWSEDVTSGSEYNPVSDSVISATSTDEEPCELPETKQIRKRKPKYKLIKKCEIQKRKLNEKLETNEIPDSTTSDYITPEHPVKISEDGCLEIFAATKNKGKRIEHPVKKSEDVCIEIFAATKNKGKRIRNKGHSCYFCQKIVLNMARHFEVMHTKEIDVAKILALPKQSKQRRDSFANLIRVGDFYHNTDVLAVKQGELILVRRPTEQESRFVTLQDYGPCPHCLGFMLKKHLWHHIKTSCTVKSNNELDKSRHVIAESNALLNDTFGAKFSTDFITNITSKLRDDNIGKFCNEDNLILRFAAMQFEKYGLTQCELIRQSMRQLSRFTLKLREMEGNNLFLSDYLNPQKFDIIVQATKLLCVSHSNNVKRPEFEVPSLALKLGYSLKKCASIKRGSCLRAGNLAGNAILQSFLDLLELEWNIRISSNALATLYNRKINATQLLPLTGDLLKLSKHIDSEMRRLRESLSESPSLKIWVQLATVCLSKIILFNKRRSGEASRMTLNDYASRPLWSQQCTQELKNSLTEFENKLAEQLTVVEVVGKRGRKVAVLLTQDTKKSIDVLIQARPELYISKDNPYIFSRTGESIMHMRGHDCLRKMCSDAYLDHPEKITSTKLRKYIATVCQVFNLTENEHDWLARHLGHDIRVHRQFYRLHESAVELTKVSRLLIAVEKGEVNKFAGRKLEDINLEDMADIDESENEDEENDDTAEKSAVRNKSPQHFDQNNVDHEQGVSSQSASLIPVQVAPREARAKRSTYKRRPWSAEEKGAVLKFFNTFIKRDCVPGKPDCLKCIEKYPVLASRNWTDVKFCVKNHLDKIRKTKK